MPETVQDRNGAVWSPTRCGRAGETTMRSTHHQEDLEVDKGVGKQECKPWLKLEPNMATECMHLAVTSFL